MFKTIPGTLIQRYLICGLCPECRQPNSGIYFSQKRGWCQSCNVKRFKDNFGKWTSGNQEIDELIQKTQLNALMSHQLLEFMPYEKFTNIEKIGEGRSSIVCKAEFVDGYGYIENWNVEKYGWNRCEKNKKVILKIFKSSQNVISKIINEVTSHMLFEHTRRIVECYGISRQPGTGCYIVVMDNRGENMWKYLEKNSHLSFKERLSLLTHIISGLNSINDKEKIIHRDFHPGNILIEEYEGKPCGYISDFELCQPFYKEVSNQKIYGILPYIAPEVLLGNPYTHTSDVYSFGVVAYKLFSNQHPYDEISANSYILEKEICHNNLRPNLNILNIPLLLKDLIKQCLNGDPLFRPPTYFLEKVILQWAGEIGILGEDYVNKDSKFYKQCKEIEKE